MEPSIEPPSPPQPPGATPSFAGRTPSKASAVRAGIALGIGLLVVIGSAVTLGAAPRTGPVAADPQLAAASASAAPERHKGPRDGMGFGFGGFDGFFGFGRRLEERFVHRLGQVTIRAIDGSSISLETDDGWTRTIELGSSTTITRGGAAATAADLHVGDEIRFRQRRNDDGSFAIEAVDVVLPAIIGTIDATAAGSITITDRDGATVTVRLGEATKIRVRGVDRPSAADLAKGQIVIVVGEKLADGSIDATTVLAGKLGDLRPGKPKRDRPNASSAPTTGLPGG